MGRTRRGPAGWGFLFAAVIPAVAPALSPGAAWAQSVDQPTKVWLGLGLGGNGAQGLDVDAVGSFQLIVQWQQHHLTFRAIAIGDGSDLLGTGSGDTLEEVGILYGRRRASSFGYLAIAGGLAAVQAKGFTGATGERRKTIGLPVTAEAGLQSRLLGVGIQAFANLNTVSLFGGVSLFVQLGWMP